MVEKSQSKLKPLTTSYMTLTDSASEILQKAILDGTFAPNSQLPPEVELVQQLGISRSTLREALKRLEEQGLILRQRGLGTFVKERSIVKDLSINFGISEMISESGQNPGTTLIDIQVGVASNEPAKELGVPDGTCLISIERIRTANRKPVVVSIDYLPTSFFGEKRIDNETLEKQSLYQFLHDEMQIRIVNGVAKITPVIATQDLASKLKIQPGNPLLRIAQTDYSINDKPILFSIEYHLPDAFVFLVNRKGPHW